MPLSDEELAYHEAGHAIIHLLSDGAISRISIERQDPRRGVQVTGGWPAAQPATQQPAAQDEAAARAQAALAVAGEAAGLLRHEQRLRAAAAADYERALHAARQVTPDEPAAERLVADAAAEVRERLRRPDIWRQVEALASLLLHRRAITGDEVARAIRDA